MEVLPHFYISPYDLIDESNFIHKKKIKHIIHISKKKKFYNLDKIEEIRIPIEYDEDNYSLEYINLDLYNYLHDTIDYIHEKLRENHSVLVVGYGYRQEIDIVAISYYMKYGRVTPQLGLFFLKTKKRNLFVPECVYEICLEKFYEDLHKI